MGKQRKRSLSSRKRAKDVSHAMLDNVFVRASDNRHIEPLKQSFETGVPRKLAYLMKQMDDVKAVDKGGKSKLFRFHQEDLPRAPKLHREKKRKGDAEGDGAGSSGGGAQAASTDGTAVAGEPSAGAGAPTSTHATQASSLKQRPRPEADQPGAERPVKKAKSRPPDGPPREKAVKFGATNDRPPELQLSGQLAKKAAAAAAAAEAASAKERQLEAAREGAQAAYAAAKARRRGDAAPPSGGGARREFAAPFMTEPGGHNVFCK